jgi:hypothetical protein
VSRIYEICGDAKPMFGADRRLDAGFVRPEPALGWDDEPPAYGEPRRRHAS